MVIIWPAIVFKLWVPRRKLYSNHKMASDDLKIRSLNEAHSSISSKLPYLDERCWQQLLGKEIAPKDIDSARKVAKALHGLKGDCRSAP